MPAENILFPRRWYGGMISTSLEVIWEMSGESAVERGRLLDELSTGSVKG